MPVQHAQATLLNEDEFKQFSQSLDLQILDSAQGLWCNMLHIHGEDIYFEQISKYPVQIVNWHDRELPPSLAEAQKIFKGVVCGGLSRETLVYKTAQDVREEKEDAIQQTGGRQLIVSTGCVVPVIAPHGNFHGGKMSLRVISGSAKGRVSLNPSRATPTRPITDRVKESVIQHPQPRMWLIRIGGMSSREPAQWESKPSAAARRSAALPI